MKAKTAPRSRLQRDEVVQRAMDLADREGLDAVTIRRLAQEFEVTPMALYWHFADKFALLTGISECLWDDIAAEVASSASPTGDWTELRQLVRAMVVVLSRHPGCAVLAPHAVLTSPSGLDLTEHALDLLERLGIPAERLAEMANFLLSTAVNLVTNRPGVGPNGGEPVSEDVLRAKRVALASLPPDRYPHVAVMAALLVDCPDVEGFLDHGVDFVVGGIRASAAATAPRPPARRRT